MSKLPKGWTQAMLGDIGEYINGRGFKKSEWRDSGRPIIRIQNLTGTSQEYNYFDGDVEDRYIALPGDLLISWAATLGVFEWKGPEAVVNQHIFKVQSHIDKDFHRLLVEYVLDDLRRHAHGSGMVHVTKSVFDGTKVPVPPLAEQRRIVDAIEEHFTRIDAAEESMRKASTRIEHFHQASFNQLFHRTGWEWSTLGEIADIKGGVTKDAKKQDDPSFVEVPYLRVANVQRGYLDLSEVTKIRVSPATLETLRLVPGDILLNEGGDRDKLGRGWIWEGQIENCIHQNHVFRARLTNPGMNPRFFSTHANVWGRTWFETNGKQTTNLASISLSTLKKLPVPIPSLAEQAAVMSEVDRRASVIDALLGSLDRGSHKSSSLRRSVLAMAFSGRLVAQDPDDEPAEVLLELIRVERDSRPTPRKDKKLVAS